MFLSTYLKPILSKKCGRPKKELQLKFDFLGEIIGCIENLVIVKWLTNMEIDLCWYEMEPISGPMILQSI